MTSKQVMCDASYTYWLFLIYIRAIRSSILCLRAIRAIRSSILCLRAIRAIRSFVSLVFFWGRSYIKNLDILFNKIPEIRVKNTYCEPVCN